MYIKYVCINSVARLLLLSLLFMNGCSHNSNQYPPATPPIAFDYKKAFLQLVENSSTGEIEICYDHKHNNNHDYYSAIGGLAISENKTIVYYLEYNCDSDEWWENGEWNYAIDIFIDAKYSNSFKLIRDNDSFVSIDSTNTQPMFAINHSENVFLHKVYLDYVNESVSSDSTIEGRDCKYYYCDSLEYGDIMEFFIDKEFDIVLERTVKGRYSSNIGQCCYKNLYVDSNPHYIDVEV